MGFLRYITFILSLFNPLQGYAEAPVWEAKSGILDLSTWVPAARPIIPLRGAWRYDWGLKEIDWLKKPTGGFLQSGSAWDRDFGSITYALRLHGLPQNQELGLEFGQFMNTLRAFAYDPLTQSLTPLATVGQVGPDRATSVPQLRKVIVPLPRAAGSDLWLVIQASSYVVRGSFAFVPDIGLWSEIQKRKEHTAYEAFWIIGMFSLLFVTNLSLFLLRRDDLSSLMMSLFSLVMGLRYASTEAILSVYFPEPNLMAFAISVCFIASALPICLCFYLHFFSVTFPGHYPRWALISSYGLAGFHVMLSALTLAKTDWPHFDSQIMAVLLVFSGLLVVRLSRLTRRREGGAALSLVGFVILLVTMSNDVLVFLQFYKFPYVGHYGMLAFIFTQSLVVASNFAKAFRTARHLTHELRKEVDRQTRDVKSILKNMHQGIFTIHPGLIIGDDYSPFLEEILGAKALTGQSVFEKLFARTQLTHEQVDMLTSILDTSLREPLLNYEVNSDNLPRDLQFKDALDRDKLLLVEWDPIVDSEGLIEKIMVTLRDVTELKQMEYKTRQNQRDMELIAEIIEVPPDRFYQFLVSSRRFLEENFRLLLTSRVLMEQDLKIIFINYHTMKGAARTYRFLSMTGEIHEAEQFIATVQKGQQIWDQDRALNELSRVRDVFNEYERVNHDKLKRDESRDVVKLELETVRENIKALESIGRIHLDERLTPFVDKVRRTFFQLYFQELRLIFANSERNLAQLGRDLQKPQPRLTIDSIAVGVTKEAAEILHDSLIHIYRNIMDHGIESPQERREHGKEDSGHLRITVTQSANQELRIRFQDDGRGIQLDKIASIGRSRKLIKPDDAPDARQVANLIFLPGFSTADGVTEISGRGIGMTAVREYLEKSGGRVEITLLEETRSLRAVAFALDIHLPATHYALLPVEEARAA